MSTSPQNSQTTERHHPFEEDGQMLFEDPLPADPCRLLQDWLDFARQRSGQPNWNTLMLATASPDGQPSVRAVLLKAYDPATGIITFYTNYTSRKALEMELNPLVS
ncbi:MAG: pyridoxamine 5'-phosphate oxidase family protein, partial [Planctomycetota bacterium]